MQLENRQTDKAGNGETGPDFLTGGGQIAAMVRGFNWANTPLGPIDHWPVEVKSIVGMMLQAQRPMIALLGEAGTMIYNDAYSDFAGARHPAILGSAVRSGWPEVADFNDHVIKTVFRNGQTLSFKDQELVLNRGAGPAKVWLDLDYSPIVAVSGERLGVIATVVETTDRMNAQDANRAHAGRFLTFAQVMPNHVWTARPDGMLDWLNNRVSEYSGKTQDQLLGAGWAEIVHPADRPGAAARWSAALDLGQPYETEFRIRDGAGQYRWHLIRAFPIRDASGAVTQWIGTNTDIDMQKRAEVETMRDRNRLWTMSQDLMLVCGYDGVITAVNPSGQRILGWDEEEMIGKTLTDFIHPDDRSAAEAELAKLTRGTRTLAYENRYLCKDGSYRVLDWTAVPDDGRIHGVARDITENRRLTKDRDRVWTISPVIKVVMSLDGTISTVNPTWTKLLGWTAQDTIGHSILDFVAPESRERSAEKLAQLQGATAMLTTESVYKVKGGGTRRIAWSTQPEGDTAYGFGRDITAETEAAAALAASQANLRRAQTMESIGQLTGGIAHDFNNLLQVVSGNLQLLAKETAGNERAERRVQNAMEAVSGGARLASQLLAFGRRQPLAPKVVNLGRLVRNIDETLRRALGEGMQIETVVAEDLWNTSVDPGNVENALLNLAINGRDAMAGQGSLKIEVGNVDLDDAFARTIYDMKPGQYVTLAVSDTGTGIAPELLEKVFEPFFTTKTEGKGSGLGLSMVYGFVKQSGGHVKVHSALGQGTTITLYLPRSLQPEDNLVLPDFGPITGGPETILVAEDDGRVRDSVVEMLVDLGYRVVQAADAQSALDIVEGGTHVDLLFTDVVMPGTLKSSDLARKAVARLPGLKVLYTSGYVENSILRAGRLEDGVELLSKPYTREVLARKLRQVLADSAGVAKNAPPDGADAERLTIVLCEDDALIRLAITEMLQDLGHVVIATGTAKDALAALAAQKVDVLMTDLGLPDLPGLEMARQARVLLPDLSVIFATGQSLVDGCVPDAKTEILLKPYTSDLLAVVIEKVK